MLKGYLLLISAMLLLTSCEAEFQSKREESQLSGQLKILLTDPYSSEFVYGFNPVREKINRFMD